MSIGKLFGYGALAIVAIGGLGVVGSVTGILTAPIRGAATVAERTFNGDNMIHNYEWFKRQVQDVAAIDERIGVAQATLASFEVSAGPRDTWKFDDRTEWNRLNTVLLGLKGQRTSMVAEYNARVEMANRNLFRTGDLPDRLF